MIMKIHSNFLLLSSAVIFLGLHKLVLADEEERPRTEQVLGFLKDKMPESLRFLERVREEDGDKGYKKSLRKHEIFSRSSSKSDERREKRSLNVF
jgi:hypothetical protein